MRRISPVGLGDSKTCARISFSSATAVSVEPTSSADQIVCSFFRRSGCSQSRWKTSARTPSLPFHLPAHQVVGLGVDLGPGPAPDGRSTIAEDRPDLHGAGELNGAHVPARDFAPHREVHRPSGHGIELLVGVAQRQMSEEPSVGRLQREVARVYGLGCRGIESALREIARVDEQVFMARRKARAQLTPLRVEVDHDLGDEVGLAEDLIQEQSEVRRLVVVDAHEDRGPGAHQSQRRLQARPHHRHPRLVLRRAPIAVAEVIDIREVVAGVVGRIDVDQVETPQRQRGEDGEVVTLDERVQP